MTAAIDYRGKGDDSYLEFIRDVAQAAVGRWISIFNQLGIEVPASHMKHGPCPNCGGKDRFRCDDQEGRGTHICSQCGAGDGLELIKKVNSCSLLEAAKMVAPLVGISEGEPWTKAQQQEVERKTKIHRDDRLKKDAIEVQRKIQKAKTIWESGQPVSPTNEYLVSKQVSSYGLKATAKAETIADHLFAPGTLIVPRRNTAGDLVGVQLIDSHAKRYVGPTKAAYHAIGKPDGILFVCEGYATGATIHQATGHAVAIASDVGNLRAVSEVLKAKLPNIRICIAADNDHLKEVNAGLEKGTQAATDAGVELVYPVFSEDQAGSDWNDYAAIHGLEATGKAITKEVGELPNFYWLDPQPLTHQLLLVEPFQTELLPEPLRDWVKDISERKDNAPIDYAAVGIIVALGALLGRKIAIHPKRHDDWRVIPNLWGVIIGRPSTKKTPILDDAIKPLKRLEVDAREDYQVASIEHQAALKLDQLKQKEVEKRATKLVKENKNSEAHTLLQKAVENVPDNPARKRYLLNDATVEKLGEILSENPMGILQFRDELTGWLNSMEREDRGQDRAFYLEAWNGQESFTYDRIGRGTVDIPSTTVSVLGGIQPGKLQPYLVAQRNGSGDDGFIERLQLMVYPDQGEFKHIDRWPDNDAKARAYEVFKRFNAIPTSEDEIPSLRFSDEAQVIFDDWYSELMLRIRAQESNPQIESHLNKYPSLMASLALIIHIAQEGTEGPVSIDAAMRACAWCEYLESHARRVYALANDPFTGARTLVGRLHSLPDPFQTKDFSRKGWAGLAVAVDIHQALDLLCEYNYLFRHVVQTTSRPRTLYHINPAVKEG